MIADSGISSFSAFKKKKLDIFVYGLGYETRSTMIASQVDQARVFALKMPATNIHAYQKNVQFAKQRGHAIISNFEEFTTETLGRFFAKRRPGPIRIGFDISSLNRVMLVEVLAEISRNCENDDSFEVYYCPAAYSEPDWQFPQLESLGPISATFSTVNADPTKPLCIIFGTGFEAALSMGMISQLEPRLSYCFWGSGVDTRFDNAVKRANFNFDFPGFNTKAIPYDIKDPKGAFSQLESVVYGLSRQYRIVLIPMGPKIFTFLSALIGMTYVGEVAIWRAQHTRMTPPDLAPAKFFIWSSLETSLLGEFAHREKLDEFSYRSASGVPERQFPKLV